MECVRSARASRKCNSFAMICVLLIGICIGGFFDDVVVALLDWPIINPNWCVLLKTGFVQYVFCDRVC